MYSGINLDSEPGSILGAPFFMETIFHSLASLDHWDNLCVPLSQRALSGSVPGFTQGNSQFQLPASFGLKVVAPVSPVRGHAQCDTSGLTFRAGLESSSPSSTRE